MNSESNNQPWEQSGSDEYENQRAGPPMNAPESERPDAQVPDVEGEPSISERNPEASPDVEGLSYAADDAATGRGEVPEPQQATAPTDQPEQTEGPSYEDQPTAERPESTEFGSDYRDQASPENAAQREEDTLGAPAHTSGRDER